MKICKEKKGYVVDGDTADFTHMDNFFAGILIDDVPDEDALMVTNQVGGTACGHPEVRGMVVKLPATWAPKDPDRDPLRDRYQNLYSSDLVNAFLDACSLANIFEPLAAEDVPNTDEPIDGNKYRMCLAEAWVPVRVKYEQPFAFLKPLEGKRMILTYQNSD